LLRLDSIDKLSVHAFEARNNRTSEWVANSILVIDKRMTGESVVPHQENAWTEAELWDELSSGPPVEV
jgi:hypothetical protein